MKKILFLLAMVLGATATAQQTITPEQIANTQRVEAKVAAYKQAVAQDLQKVLTIAGQINDGKKAQIKEIVATRIASKQRVDRMNATDDQKNEYKRQIDQNFERNLVESVGAQKAAQVMTVLD